MAQAYTSSEYKSQRHRFFSNKKSKLKSHYIFKNWQYENDNMVAHITKSKKEADLISSYYFNRTTKTKTVYCIPFDLDYDKTDKKWIVDKRINWIKVRDFLSKHEPDIFRSITHVAWSTSGRGLGMTISISPLEIIDETKAAQIAASTLQGHIIQILKSYGIGADPAARGLARDMPNWQNPKRIVYNNEIQKRIIDNRRIPVVKDLLSITNNHPMIRQLKRDRDDLLWLHEGVERKLVPLYQKLLDESGDHYYTLSDLLNLTKLSKSTLYKFLNTKLDWIDCERIDKWEGYRLTLKPELKYSSRVGELLSSKSNRKKNPFLNSWIKMPSEVEDGERNHYITSISLALKHGGILEKDANSVLQSIVKEIPNYIWSRNCRNYQTILKSIYRNRPKLYGTKTTTLPYWILEKCQNLFDEIEFPKTDKKGYSFAILHSKPKQPNPEDSGNSRKIDSLDFDFKLDSLIQIDSLDSNPKFDSLILDRSLNPNNPNHLTNLNRSLISTPNLIPNLNLLKIVPKDPKSYKPKYRKVKIRKNRKVIPLCKKVLPDGVISKAHYYDGVDYIPIEGTPWLPSYTVKLKLTYDPELVLYPPEC
jgi:hypothetical protein